MKLRVTSFAVLLVSLLMLASGAQAGNLLVNSGFETGDFTGWSVTAPLGSGVAVSGTSIAAYFPGQVNVRTGSYAAYGVVRNFPSPEPIVLTQTVSAAPFQTLDIGFYASNWSTSTVGIAVGYANAPYEIEIYVNGTAILSSTPGFQNMQNDASWYNFDGTYANGGQTALTVSYRFVGSGFGSFPVSLDDFYVNGNGASATPEPSTLLMLGSGVLGLAGVARRKLKL